MERNEVPWARHRALQFSEATTEKPPPAPLLWRVHAAWLVLVGRAEITLWTAAEREPWRDALGAPPPSGTRDAGDAGGAPGSVDAAERRPKRAGPDGAGSAHPGSGALPDVQHLSK